MLQRKEGGKEPVLATYGYLISVELDVAEVIPESLTAKLADALSWVEGCGQVDVDMLGKIDVVDE